ncbi:hypothetical protein BpHYR1_049464 [Brachionus plicatilis]|uniref:Uncharacterized protein n=1 Tax=Brachionus plicatilis TaxID=10195 RepID=A0A3M7R635_BRAPC|nr:hypothetical protein BpHYR1_049464 [Brachionus plicatilis]
MLYILDINCFVIKRSILKFCRLRKSPILSELDKLKRLIWGLRYINLDFENCIFVDETAVRIVEINLKTYLIFEENMDAKIYNRILSDFLLSF